MRKKIGEFLVSKGVLKETQVEQILNYGKMKGMRFGEAGLEMGILTQEALISAFGPNYLVDFFHLVPEYFPEITRDLFAKEALIRFGVLPLGYKTVSRFFRAKKILNIGMLDPSSEPAREIVEQVAQDRLAADYAGVKAYLVLPNEFVQVLEQVYLMKPGEITKLGSESIEPTLRLYLDM